MDWSNQLKRVGGVQEDEALEEEAPEEEAEEPVDVLLTGNRDHDKLPGGTIVVWGGERPEWFAALHQNRSKAERRSAQPAEAPVSTSGESTEAGEPLSLSEKQRKKCLKVACKMLKKCQGGIKLKEVVDSALEALNVSQSMGRGKLRSKVRTAIKKGHGWSIQDGMLMTVIAVSS